MHTQRFIGGLALTLILVSGCSAGSTSPSSPKRVDVQGRVVSAAGLPVAGVSVSVNGATAQVTGDDGRFEAAGVTPPYDVAVGQPEWSRAVVWAGLRRADPVLTFPWGPSGEKTGHFCGDASGTNSSSTPPAVLVETPFGSPAVTHPMTEAGGAYCGGAAWSGDDATVAATIHVLQTNWTVEGSDWIASDFPAYGTAETTLTAGSTISGVDLALAPVSATSLSVSTTLPEGCTHVHRIVEGGTTAVDIAVGLPPALLEPAADAASVGPGSRFAWTPFQGGDLNALFAGCPDGSSVQVFTEAVAVSLPDTGAVGVAFPAGGACTWSVVALGGTGGIDLLAAGPADPLSDSPSRDAEMAYSTTRSFTAR